MTESLKKKTVSSLIWNAIDKVGFQLIQLIVGVITARILSPKDFGLIGALSIFTVLSSLLLDSGFSVSLIRRAHNTREDYTTAFYFNLLISFVLYAILFFSAPAIAAYFRMPELTFLARLLFLSLILTSCGIVQNIILTKELSFRILTISNILSVVLSGIATVIMVKSGVGYIALAWQVVIQSGSRTILLWILSPWRIGTKLNFNVIKEVFNFSAILLLTNIIVAVVRHIYNIIIGRVYSVQSLGYYSQAFKYQQIPSTIIAATITGVAYPVLSKLRETPDRQLLYSRKILRIIAFMVFPSMIMLYALSDELISIVLTDKWLPSAPYFRILLIAGTTFPIHSFYLTLMNVDGHSKRNFTLEMIRNALIITFLIFGLDSIEKMLYGFVAASVISYIIDLFFVKRLINYRIIDQIKDIAPYLIISIGMYLVITVTGWIKIGLVSRTLIQMVCGGTFYFLTLYLLDSKILKDALGFVKNLILKNQDA